GRPSEMAVVPEDWTGLGVKYLVPRCNLALSDTFLLIVDLDEGQKTKLNKHPGFELAIPLGEGEIAVEFTEDERQFKVSGKDRQYAHYSSQKYHRLVNIGPTSAKVFVARFLGGHPT